MPFPRDSGPVGPAGGWAGHKELPRGLPWWLVGPRAPSRAPASAASVSFSLHGGSHALMKFPASVTPNIIPQVNGPLIFLTGFLKELRNVLTASQITTQAAQCPHGDPPASLKPHLTSDWTGQGCVPGMLGQGPVRGADSLLGALAGSWWLSQAQ